jgi:poly-gamma-glutamate capsule biosynthesis protein CapA/YwtB (metallophosphatase superfamily)
MCDFRHWLAVVGHPKVFHFRSDEKDVAVLNVAGLHGVSLANNHTLDFGAPAMLDMLRTLDAAGIACSGAGANLVAAANPAITIVRGLRIGLISFTDNEPSWEATPKTAGVFYVPVDVCDPRSSKLFELDRFTRQRVDLLIVAAHWGGNWGYLPPKPHVEFGRALIRAGADVVFGHSAHVVRGIEIVQGRPIVYSAGNFIDDYAVDPNERNDESFIFVLETRNGVIDNLRLYPTLIRNFQATHAPAADARDIASTMIKLCSQFGTPLSWDASQNYLDIRIH